MAPFREVPRRPLQVGNGGSINELTRVRHAEVDERSRARGRMAAGITHDLNNQLSPIVGLSELLLTRPYLLDDHEKLLKFLGAIHKAGLDAALVVDRLHEFFQTPDGDQQVAVVNLDLVVERTSEVTQSMWSDRSMSTETITAVKAVRIHVP